MEKISKHSQIKEYLLDKKSITTWQAIEMFGATRLSAIIFDLKKSGMNIETTTIVSKDRNGHTCQFAKYKLVE